MDQQDQIRQDQAHLEAVVAEALEIAKGLGASLAEVSISKQTGLSVNTRGCELESIEFNKDGALGIAVYRDGCKGSSSTTDLGKPAIRAAVEEGEGRGASTLSQQVVKNTFLWHGRSYLRKAMEAAITPVIELLWSKQRILEVYLNTAEFAEGVFGVQAAAQHHFGVDAADLSALQAARLAAVLPNPKDRSASEPSSFVRKRTRSILSGAETIDVDGRAGCFQ